VSASARQHEIGRAWARALYRPQNTRDAWARFEAEEQRRDDEHEQKGGNA
jgi:hypothetical protein